MWYLGILVNRDSKWTTQNGESKEREFHIFSKFSTVLFDIRYLGAFQDFIQKVYN